MTQHTLTDKNGTDLTLHFDLVSQNINEGTTTVSWSIEGTVVIPLIPEKEEK